MALGAVARIGGGWPSGLLSWWCCSRQRPVCPAVSGRGGTIPRSRAQVRGVFPAGRAHCAVVGLRGDVKQRAGRSQPVGLLVVGELAEQVVRGCQIRNRAARRSRWWAWIWVGSPRWCACRVCAASPSSTCSQLSTGNEGQLRDCEGVSLLQPGSLTLIRDTGALRARLLLASTAPYRSW